VPDRDRGVADGWLRRQLPGAADRRGRRRRRIDISSDLVPGQPAGASLPVDPEDSRQIKESADRLDFVWYNIEPVYGAHSRDFNPHLSDRQNVSVSAIDIELNNALSPADADKWVGLIRNALYVHPKTLSADFRPTKPYELDLSNRRYIEIWINDFKPDPQDRGGKIYIDVGIIDENFYEPDSMEWNDEDVERDGYQEYYDDTGLDGAFNRRPDDLPPGYRRGDEGGVNEDDDRAGDDYDPRRIDGRFEKVNGTEKNQRHDTEDLDSSGHMNTANSYFRYEVDLTSQPILDVRAEYPDYNGFNNEPHRNDSWRWFRIELADGVPVAPGFVPAPDLTKVRHIRIWFEDVGAVVRSAEGDGLYRIQIAKLKFSGRPLADD
jgi:hypothetical protein